jgi:ABC-type multidrug transport system fused ATPase/permease subunit
MNNLQFVCPEATSVEIEEALDQAHLLEFIRNLPEGLHTMVGDRGLKLSGGEKQRLSLVRFFLKKPKICIFDESTSSLDKDTDFAIQDNIEKFFPNMTKIIITHRPYLAHKVDQIITLDRPNSLTGPAGAVLLLEENHADGDVRSSACIS